MSPLKNIMKELQLRRVHIYPRCVIFSLVNIRVVRLVTLLLTFSHSVLGFTKMLRTRLKPVKQT